MISENFYDLTAIICTITMFSVLTHTKIFNDICRYACDVFLHQISHLWLQRLSVAGMKLDSEYTFGEISILFSCKQIGHHTVHILKVFHNTEFHYF